MNKYYITLFRPGIVLTLAVLLILYQAGSVLAFKNTNDIPATLLPYYKKLQLEGDRNEVLNHMRTGLAAMDLGYLSLAAEQFDDALLKIEAIYANGENASRARSLWYEEGMKNFKGEPYERVMAYYYRGILYLAQGDYENARASFKSGALQDAFAEEHQNRCDFALMVFMQGWASACNGDTDLAQQASSVVTEMRPQNPFRYQGNNIIVLVETGMSPRKVSDGVGHAMLRYKRGRGFTETRVLIETSSKAIEPFPIESIYWQAKTRGGRPIDAILNGQVQFKKKAQSVASATGELSSNAMVAAPLFSSSANVVGGAAALGIISGISSMMAINAKAQADARYWDNLPDMIHVATYYSPSFTDENVTRYFTSNGKELYELKRSGAIITSDEKCGILWIRSRSALNLDDGAE